MYVIPFLGGLNQNQTMVVSHEFANNDDFEYNEAGTVRLYPGSTSDPYDYIRNADSADIQDITSTSTVSWQKNDNYYFRQFTLDETSPQWLVIMSTSTDGNYNTAISGIQIIPEPGTLALLGLAGLLLMKRRRI